MIATHPASRAPAASELEAYLGQINETPLLSAQQERELTRRVSEGDCEARDHLVRANLRLVVSLARGYAGRGLELPDLIAEGNLGLLRAAEGFDPEMETRFSTYAAYWIKQSMRRAICNTARSVRLPCATRRAAARRRRAAAALAEELGRQPDDEEVAGRLGLSEKKLRVVKKAIRIHTGTPQAEGGEDVRLEELVADGGGQAPGAALERADELREVLRLVDGLGGRDREVLRLRFGLGGEEPMTLKDIGERLDLTRERVRQIETLALRALRERLTGD